MPLLLLLLLAGWTLIVVRLAGARAALSERTGATYVLVGALGGLVALPLLEHAVSPLLPDGPFRLWVVCALYQAALLLPVALALFRHGEFAALSVADAFLIAFLVGFGFELGSYLLDLAAFGAPISGLTGFPPWQLHAGKWYGAGYAYTSGLVALAVAAMLRTGRPARAACGAGAAAYLLAVGDHWLWQSPSRGWDGAWNLPFRLGSTLSLHGKLTAGLALVALVALSVWEAHQVARAEDDASGAKFDPLKDWRVLLGAISRLRLEEYRRVMSVVRLQRQARIARAEAVRAPESPTLSRLARELHARAEADPEDAPPAPPIPLRQRLLNWCTAPWIALFVLLALPRVPTLNGWFWRLPLHGLLSPLQVSVLNAVLLAVLVRQLLRSHPTPVPHQGIEGLVQFQGTQCLRLLALGVALIVGVYVYLQDLYPRQSFVFSSTQLGTLLLLFALGAVGLDARAGEAALTASARREKVLQVTGAATRLAAVWIGLAFFGPCLTTMDEWTSPRLRPHDLRDLDGLAQKLRDTPDPVSGYLRGQLSTNTQSLLTAQPGTVAPDALRSALAGELSRILATEQIYDKDRFKDFPLPKAAQELALRHPRGMDRARLNRLLIEAAYPTQVARGPDWLRGLLTAAVPLLAAVLTAGVSAGALYLLMRAAVRLEVFLGEELPRGSPAH